MANQMNELMHLKYEQAHLAYLCSIQNVWDADAGVYGQKTLSQLARKDETPQSFDDFIDADGWCGVSISASYLADCLIEEYRRQEPAITKLMQGTFGQVLRSDPTRKSETEKSLELIDQGLAKRYDDAGVEKANYHWVDRDFCAPFKIPDLHPGEYLSWDAWRTTESLITEATAGILENTSASRTQYNPHIVLKLDLFQSMRCFTRECTSEHHPLFSTFCQLLYTAFTVVDQEDLQRLTSSVEFSPRILQNNTSESTVETELHSRQN
ncbi:Hypothetical protein SMAX5B_001247 [Scophthalmus maximus]|uniref:Uncharacterized protein n=1 Tax=Scophthalmus maximus TaxID=52904 RepID=A0A2U9CV83_SCOMX|nr:Hypothetical protein SMAX5B_001247 [Scophthalmus maximus]